MDTIFENIDANIEARRYATLVTEYYSYAFGLWRRPMPLGGDFIYNEH